MKKFGLPILIILILSFCLGYLERLLNAEALILVTILRAGLLFYLGICLRPGNKRSQRWVGKVVISFIFALFLVYEMGYLPFYEVNAFLGFLGIRGYIIFLIYVICGCFFFD